MACTARKAPRPEVAARPLQSPGRGYLAAYAYLSRLASRRSAAVVVGLQVSSSRVSLVGAAAAKRNTRVGAQRICELAELPRCPDRGVVLGTRHISERSEVRGPAPVLQLAAGHAGGRLPAELTRAALLHRAGSPQRDRPAARCSVRATRQIWVKSVGACSSASIPEHTTMRGSVPMGRHGRPEEISDAVLWLCSTASSYVTGQSISVDGGFVMR